MKIYLSITIASILVLSAPSKAQAQFEMSTEIGGIPALSGASLENFDGPSTAILTLSGPAYLLTGADYRVAYVPPYFSGSTAAFFGESPQNGLDNSRYVVVEAGGTATLSFSTPKDYLGLLWGSVDEGNALTFYDSENKVIGTIFGSDVLGVTYSELDEGSTSYVNITSTIPFSSVVATCSWNSFEFDDVAYAAPEPSTLGLVGFSLLALLRKAAR